MDRITKQLVKELVESQELQSLSESEQFEAFVNYSIVSSLYSRSFNISDVEVAGGDDTGLDGVGIVVNGMLVTDVADIDNMLAANGYLDVTYIFIQSKTSPKFETGDIRKFTAGVVDFFSETPSLRRNLDVERFSEISNYILDNASSFKGSPVCKLYYVTTGKYDSGDANLEACITSFEQDIEKYNIFDRIEFKYLGAKEIINIFRATKNPMTAKFTFSNKITLDDIDGIPQAYYGVLPFSEFKKILVDENDNITSVFDDNVRDFQGLDNPVNKVITQTLESDNPFLFSVVNNGITVVVNDIKTSGNSFTIFDYQIVNGCQTSNVLYSQRNNPSLDGLSIPIRIIETKDEAVKTRITVSTNNQTAIKKEQLFATSEFQKNLELYYNSIEGEGRLFYERRAKQYNSDQHVIKRRIISTQNQIKAFSSMFEQDPHIVTSQYGMVVKRIGTNKLFAEDHEHSIYYMSGLAYYRLENFFTTNQIDKKYKKVRFFILMLVRMLLSDGKNPSFNSRKQCDSFCDPMIKKLNDTKSCLDAFKKCVEIIESSGIDYNDKQVVKSKETTNTLILTCEKYLSTLSSSGEDK